ncbi:hypothetical protein B296_00028988 [Ensete ventricosum]|uniref:Uncharacterized protein n=1 Tax=Ensete ventricosum TaxID=4639 RepID=A0A426XQD8_ENSVE|nr:hypothetical protein B296_00028988 [Ensete ventricosum]
MLLVCFELKISHGCDGVWWLRRRSPAFSGQGGRRWLLRGWSLASWAHADGLRRGATRVRVWFVGTGSRTVGPTVEAFPLVLRCPNDQPPPLMSKHITAVSLETFRGSDRASTVRAPRVGPVAGTSRAPE